jgi:hypothetical protein
MAEPQSVEKIMDSLKMNFLFNMRTGDPFIDMIISSLIAVGISIIFSQWNSISESISLKKYMSCFNDRYYSTITIEGTRTFRNSSWSVRTNNIWGKRFDAIWDYINSESNYNGINRLKEMMDNTDTDTCEIKNKFDKDIYVVDANCRAFPLNNEKTIYVQVTFSDNKGDSDKLIEICGKVDTIRIEIYSRVLSIIDLKNYVDNLTLNYLKKIEEHRKGKIFIYSLQSSTNDDEEGNNKNSKNWMERPFRSTRKFDNLYFDGKNDLIEKIDFFTNNKEWYEKEGHPYTLGIGLSGSPGTGKTSVIKCLANKLKRHLIQIPLNKVKNEADFYRYYFESTYSGNNVTNSVDFENKIIVLEDIDCMSDIILDRNNKVVTDISNTELDMLENIVNAVSIVSDDKKSTSKSSFKKEDKLTLSFILNLIDGLDENYGRILIITSNFYDKIDPALIRPGRIDLKIEMKKASIQTIKDMYYHYYNSKLPNKYISQLKDDCISPAELVNYYRTTYSSKQFLEMIVKHCDT